MYHWMEPQRLVRHLLKIINQLTELNIYVKLFLIVLHLFISQAMINII